MANQSRFEYSGSSALAAALESADELHSRLRKAADASPAEWAAIFFCSAKGKKVRGIAEFKGGSDSFQNVKYSILSAVITEATYKKKVFSSRLGRPALTSSKRRRNPEVPLAIAFRDSSGSCQIAGFAEALETLNIPAETLYEWTLKAFKKLETQMCKRQEEVQPLRPAS